MAANRSATDTHTSSLIDSEALVGRCLADGEFMMAARYWTGGLAITDGNTSIEIQLSDGVPRPGAAVADQPTITLSAEPAVWAAITEPVPKPFFHDITSALGRGVVRTGDELIWWQYAPAVQRLVELLADPRPNANPSPADSGSMPRHDSPVGRYIHLDLDGSDHRIYYEEAGSGIPILLQHTAGSHGTQWRHLFENPAITERFRLIAYDLPYHGKSVPPVHQEWWSQEYRLTGEFLRSVPLQLAAGLNLDRPVFMGCSVGGLLALDLAARHPEAFRHVISLEGALHIVATPTG